MVGFRRKKKQRESNVVDQEGRVKGGKKIKKKKRETASEEAAKKTERKFIVYVSKRAYNFTWLKPASRCCAFYITRQTPSHKLRIYTPIFFINIYYEVLMLIIKKIKKSSERHFIILYLNIGVKRWRQYIKLLLVNW